jgi:hypothetical protein
VAVDYQEYDSANYFGNLPSNGEYVDTSSWFILAARKGFYGEGGYASDWEVRSLMKFDSIQYPVIPLGSKILQATLYLTGGPPFRPPFQLFSHSLNQLDGDGDYPFLVEIPGSNWSYGSLIHYGQAPTYQYYATSLYQSFAIDARDFINDWLLNGNRGLIFHVNPSYQYTSTPYYSKFYRISDSSGKVPHIDVSYSVVTQQPDTITGYMLIHYNPTCDTLVDYSCNSVVTDTSLNPYTTGVLGNWRGNRSYTYYGTRAETDPGSATDVRRNGAFHDFAPYWVFQSKRLQAQPDTTRWVWNSEMTMFNPKGMEIENKDPLGRYNSILYGYDNTLPMAVIQNGHYRESAFEGFEDYGFVTANCDIACPAARHVDFGPYLTKLSTVQKHSGKSSLLLDPSDQVGLSFPLVSQEPPEPTLSFITATDECPGVGDVLSAVKTTNDILLPTFSPFKGRKMVVSVWVKEVQSCDCSSYVNSAVKVECTGSTGLSTTFLPAGPIIEGWQRCEGVFTIPDDGTALSVNLEATGATQVYFDDLRVHPFNANMKSFVYNPVNLRLMAEQDENNYTTFYEYDDDGTLIRVKKETERGIQTIKETRSALLKQEP